MSWDELPFAGDPLSGDSANEFVDQAKKRTKRSIAKEKGKSLSKSFGKSVVQEDQDRSGKIATTRRLFKGRVLTIFPIHPWWHCPRGNRRPLLVRAMPQIARVVDRYRAPTTPRLVRAHGSIGSNGQHAPSSGRLVGDVFELDVRSEGPFHGCKRPHPPMMTTLRSTCPRPGAWRPRMTCLGQTRPGSNCTVAPRSQRRPTPDTKDHLGLLHPIVTFQTRHISGSVVDSPIDPDSLDNTLAFDVEFSQCFVIARAPIGPDSLDDTLAFDVEFSQGFVIAAV